MDDFIKIVRLGTIPCGGRRVSVFCKIVWKDGRLSITGVEGPLASGNCMGGCGQIVMSMDSLYRRDMNLAPGWTSASLRQFVEVWRRWHRNDMKAGSPRQQAWLEDHPDEHSGDYTSTCVALQLAGLNPDPEYLHDGKPYAYGTAWLREDVPDGVLDWLATLPNTDKTPAWI